MKTKLFDLIPEDALSLHTGVLGKTRSGKTNTSKVIVEGLVAEGYRVCVLDPIKSDWWGITSSSDGKKPGLPFQILGGPHGHVPLHGGAGAAVGGLVASGELPHSVIDMAHLGPEEFNSFFHAFAEKLFKSKRKQSGVVYLVMEEAHEFAPKERAGLDGENMSLYWTKKLATGAGSLGIRLIVCTQAVQQLSNRVFGSLETIIAHRMTAPADIAPTMKWFKQNASKETAKAIEDSIPKLDKGDSWIYSAMIGQSKRVQWPLCSTFDNSSTPTKHGSASHEVTTARVDTDSLRKLLGEAVKEAEANDPERLRDQIKTLQTQLEEARIAQTGKSEDAEADVDALQDLVEREQGAATKAKEQVERLQNRITVAKEIMGTNRDVVQQLPSQLADLAKELRSTLEEKLRAEMDQCFAAFNAAIAEPAHSAIKSFDEACTPFFTVTDERGSPIRAVVNSPVRTPVRMKPMPAAPAKRDHHQMPPGSDPLTDPEQRVLDALAFWARCGSHQPDRAAVAPIANYTHTSTSFTKALSSLKTRGFISYPDSETARLEEAGRPFARAIEFSGGLKKFHEIILGKLSDPERRALRPILSSYPRPLSREVAAEAAGYTPTSTSFTKALSSLRTRKFVDYPNSESVVALAALFPSLRGAA